MSGTRPITGGDRITVTTANGTYDANIVSADSTGYTFTTDGDSRVRGAVYIKGGAEIAKAMLAERGEA